VLYLHAWCLLVEWAWLFCVSSVIWSSGVHYSFQFTISYFKIVLTVPSELLAVKLLRYFKTISLALTSCWVPGKSVDCLRFEACLMNKFTKLLSDHQPTFLKLIVIPNVLFLTNYWCSFYLRTTRWTHKLLQNNWLVNRYYIAKFRAAISRNVSVLQSATILRHFNEQIA